MYLYLGQDTVVPTREIVGIFDMDNTTVSRGTREFLAQAERAGETVTVSEELPKSFVVCQGRNGTRRVYISQISCATLLKRAKRIESN